MGNPLVRLAGSRRFQAFCARVPGLRRIARSEGAALSAALRTVTAERSARKESSVRVQVDPLTF